MIKIGVCVSTVISIISSVRSSSGIISSISSISSSSSSSSSSRSSRKNKKFISSRLKLMECRIKKVRSKAGNQTSERRERVVGRCQDGVVIMI